MSTSFASSTRSHYVESNGNHEGPASMLRAFCSIFDAKRNGKLQILVAEMDHPITGVSLHTRKRGGKIYKKSFRGSDAIEWILIHYRNIVNIRSIRRDDERQLYHNFTHHGHAREHQRFSPSRRKSRISNSGRESPTVTLPLSSRAGSKCMKRVASSHDMRALASPQGMPRIRSSVNLSSLSASSPHHVRKSATESDRSSASVKRRSTPMLSVPATHTASLSQSSESKPYKSLTYHPGGAAQTPEELRHARLQQILRQRRKEALVLAQELLDRGYIMSLGCDVDDEYRDMYVDSRRRLYTFTKQPPTLHEDQIDELIERMTDPIEGVPHADRQHMYSRCRYCFVGREATDWVLNRVHIPNMGYRENAKYFMQYLVEQGVLLPMQKGETERFEDSRDLFYSFIVKLSAYSFVTNDHVYDMIHAMKKAHDQGGLLIQDRSTLFHSYRDTFIGNEAVSWMCRYLDLFSREEAVQMGRELLRRGLIANVSKPASNFADDDHYYTLLDIGSLSGYMRETRQIGDKPQRLLWFVLKNNKLYAYRSPSCRNLVYTLKLESAAICPVTLSENDRLLLEDASYRGLQKEHFDFEIRTESQRYRLQCRSSSELDMWCMSLRACTTQNTSENEFLDQAEAMITGASYHRAHLQEQEIIHRLRAMNWKEKSQNAQPVKRLKNTEVLERPRLKKKEKRGKEKGIPQGVQDDAKEKIQREELGSAQSIPPDLSSLDDKRLPEKSSSHRKSEVPLYAGTIDLSCYRPRGDSMRAMVTLKVPENDSTHENAQTSSTS